MKNLTLVEKFKKSLTSISELEDGSFFYDEGSLYDNFLKDPDLPLIIEKLDNLMKLMKLENKKGTLDEFLDRDIETDIWHII